MDKEKFKNPVITLDDGRFMVELKKTYYQKEAVFSAAYKFTNKCTIVIEPTDERTVGIYFKSKPNSNIDIEKIANDFCNEVLDQQLRLDLDAQFGDLKKIIYEKAFEPLKK